MEADGAASGNGSVAAAACRRRKMGVARRFTPNGSAIDNATAAAVA
jgi:hypothetical protein